MHPFLIKIALAIPKVIFVNVTSGPPFPVIQFQAERPIRAHARDPRIPGIGLSFPLFGASWAIKFLRKKRLVKLYLTLKLHTSSPPSNLTFI
jgi:hypothetical protein